MAPQRAQFAPLNRPSVDALLYSKPSGDGYEAGDVAVSGGLHHLRPNEVAYVMVGGLGGMMYMTLRGRSVARASAQLATNNVHEVFREHAGIWKWGTAASSSHSDTAMHPSYQRVIGLGPAALPLILHDLEETGDPWYWALEAISGENPIPESHYGQIDLMTEDWLNWGRRRHLI